MKASEPHDNNDSARISFNTDNQILPRENINSVGIWQDMKATYCLYNGAFSSRRNIMAALVLGSCHLTASLNDNSAGISRKDGHDIITDHLSAKQGQKRIKTSSYM